MVVSENVAKLSPLFRVHLYVHRMTHASRLCPEVKLQLENFMQTVRTEILNARAVLHHVIIDVTSHAGSGEHIASLSAAIAQRRTSKLHLANLIHASAWNPIDT